MRELRDGIRRPVTWMTLLIVALGTAMIIAAFPLGLPVQDGVQIWRTLWIGVYFAQLISLGVWVALREGPLLGRIPIPLGLLLVQIVASAIGERINSTPTSGLLVQEIAGFATACAVFLVPRKFGWRIVSARRPNAAFSLAHLFLAVTYTAVAVVIWTWAVSDPQGQIDLADSLRPSTIMGHVIVGTLATLILCILAFPCIGLVMRGGRRYGIQLACGLAIALVVVLFGNHSRPVLGPMLLPLSMVLVIMWVFSGYRSCGYHLVGQPSPRPISRYWFLVGTSVVVIVIICSAIGLHGFRVREALNEPWREMGLYPQWDEDNIVEGATYHRSSTDMTWAGLEALKQQPSLRRLWLQGAFSPEQIGWAAELSGVDELLLYGKNFGDEHLKMLHDARHLQRIDLKNTSVTVTGKKRLQQMLPNCEVDRDGNVLGGPGVNAQKAKVRVVRE